MAKEQVWGTQLERDAAAQAAADDQAREEKAQKDKGLTKAGYPDQQHRPKGYHGSHHDDVAPDKPPPEVTAAVDAAANPVST
jgi:hypothetical protein